MPFGFPSEKAFSVAGILTVVPASVLLTFEELLSHQTDILTDEGSIDTEGLTRTSPISGWRRWPRDPVPNQPRGRRARVHREARRT